ncbi:MAG: hypothetical protein E6J14_05610 [Chloroflexi bacterium]|nr:MAG: hypothetical protein E6J14_05610 [Chloroflexota bacterium]
MPTTTKVLYVEPDDEITDLVERIRQNTDMSELVFVLPNRARVLGSPLNLRLLQQYGRSYGKTTAIVSGDPRVQALSRDIGFPTYASVQAFERGVEVVRPHAPVEDRNGEDAMPAIGAGTVATVDAAEAAWAARHAQPPPPPFRPRPRPTRSWYYAAAAVFVVGLLLLFLVAPSAKVTVDLAATPVAVNPTVQGSTDPSNQNQPDHVVTAVATSDANQQFQANPTGTKDVPATPATGAVVFMTDLPNGANFTIPKNETFQTSDASVTFFATADTPVQIPPGGAPSNPVPVQDGAAEAKGNLPANSITQWPQNPCRPGGANSDVCRPSDLTVSNPQPTSGGADQKHLVVASAQDVAGWNQQVQTLEKQLGDRVKADMQNKQHGLTPAVDPGGSGTTLSNDVSPPVPKAGDEFAPANLTVTVHGKGVFYNPADIRKVVEQDLSGQVPQGETLANQPKIGAVKVTQALDDGTVIFSVDGSGFSEPTFDISGLKDQLTGKSGGDARKLLRQRLGADRVQNVDISQSIPFFVLPYFSSRIELQIMPIEKPSS